MEHTEEAIQMDNSIEAKGAAINGAASTSGALPDATAQNEALKDDDGGACVLIVDDTPANVRLLAGILKVEGFRVATASNGPDALEQIPVVNPDVVLLDVMMPGMNGFEVCRHIRADAATRVLPVVMVTALQSTEDRVRSLEAGADDFLTKPVDDVEVLARVRSLIRVKRGRDELDTAYHELRRAEAMRDSLTAMLVHDLRTPLTTILGPLEMLQTGQFGALDDIQKEIIAMSTRSGYRLLGLVNELLDVSKLESGQMTLHRAPTEVSALLNDALEQITTLAQSDGTPVEQNVALDLPMVSADADLLRRVLINLLGNALKFTPRDGLVTLSARLCPGIEAPASTHAAATSDVETSLDEDSADSNNALLISVRDTGEGIPAEDRERIFEKFGQVESRRAGRKMSTGLGLTFCKLAVEAHGGRIWVESETGQGSTFFFTLPL